MRKLGKAYLRPRKFGRFTNDGDRLLINLGFLKCKNIEALVKDIIKSGLKGTRVSRDDTPGAARRPRAL